jgi:hypothetical protein
MHQNISQIQVTVDDRLREAELPHTPAGLVKDALDLRQPRPSDGGNPYGRLHAHCLINEIEELPRMQCEHLYSLVECTGASQFFRVPHGSDLKLGHRFDCTLKQGEPLA